MDLIALLDHLPHSTARVCWLERGTLVRRSASELHADVRKEAARLFACGIKPGWRVGIRAANGYRWLVIDLALLQVRARSAAFTADFDDRDDDELIEAHGLSLLFVDKPRPGTGAAGCVIEIEDAETTIAAIAPVGINCDLDFDRPWLAFSSGSAGGVKGLMLSRRGVEAAVAGVAEALACTSADSLLLFLPMSNFQQRLLHYGVLSIGGELILSNPVSVFNALRAVSPTIIVAPPVFYDLICAKVAALPPAKKAALAAFDLISRVLPEVAALRLRRAVYRRVHRALGGKVRLMITGMAPTKRETLLACARMGLPLFETYGQIEVASVAINLPGASRLGSVGRLLPGVELKFGEGEEILVRRTLPITVGYTQAAAGEAGRVFLADDWIASGDVGSLDTDGYLYLAGRKKLLLISAGGTKYHPEMLEGQIEGCPGVRGAVVYQDERHDAVRLIVSVENGEATDGIRTVLARHNRANPEFCVTGEVVTTEAFSLQNGLLRPNLKIDRNAVIARFGEAA